MCSFKEKKLPSRDLIFCVLKARWYNPHTFGLHPMADISCCKEEINIHKHETPTRSSERVKFRVSKKRTRTVISKSNLPNN